MIEEGNMMQTYITYSQYSSVMVRIEIPYLKLGDSMFHFVAF